MEVSAFGKEWGGFWEEAKWTCGVEVSAFGSGVEVSALGKEWGGFWEEAKWNSGVKLFHHKPYHDSPRERPHPASG